MFAWKRLVLFGFLALALLFLSAAFFAKIRFEPELHKRIAAACPECRAEWKSFSLRPTGISFGGLDFESPPKAITVYEMQAQSVEIDVNWRQAMHGVLDLSAVRIWGADIKIKEIAGHNPPSPPPESAFAVRGIEVEDSTFTYEIREKGKFGRVRLDGISASISPFGTMAELHDQRVIGKAKARLEHSGQVDLEVDAALFSPEPSVRVKLSLSGQKLAELNEYFTPIDGVELAGEVLKGNASAEIHGKNLSAWADIRYEKFDVHFNKTKQRGGLKAFLSNIVADLKLDPKKIGPDAKSVGIQRRKLESIVSFILRGLKEAALRVAAV
ncbi:MAG: hypothetical protein ACXWQO_07745 [Bdellovibrionota bacterium]